MKDTQKASLLTTLENLYTELEMTIQTSKATKREELDEAYFTLKRIILNG